MVEAVVDVMGEAYPDLARNADFVVGVAAREEERFRANLRSGWRCWKTELAGGTLIGGETAFKLHDTHGFPIELTREIAAGQGADGGRRRLCRRHGAPARAVPGGRRKPNRRRRHATWPSTGRSWSSSGRRRSSGTARSRAGRGSWP